jgi:hypothetical protein
MANRDIELAQCIFFDASDALWMQYQIDNTDEIDCSQCGESHDSRKMFVEQMTNIQDQALELEKRLCECVEGCDCGNCRFSEVNDG